MLLITLLMMEIKKQLSTMHNLIVAGCRTFNKQIHQELVYEVLSKVPQPYTILHGGAKGIALIAEQYATENNIETEIYIPDYFHNPDHIAPMVRNRELAQNGDMLFAFWNGISKGTLNIITEMLNLKKPVNVYYNKNTFKYSPTIFIENSAHLDYNEIRQYRSLYLNHSIRFYTKSIKTNCLI